MRIKHIILSAGTALILASCSAPKESLTYFANIDTEYVPAEVSSSQYLSTVQPGDELMITVNSTQPLLTAIYNLPLNNPATNANGVSAQSTPQNATYIVDSKGNINFPILGILHVEGLNLEQISDMITAEISKTVDDPIVNVRLVNFSIEVAGEVKNPGTILVSRERYSLLDAITEAGDLTEYGKRNNVLLVREENGKRVAHRLDLGSADFLTSPYFYARQNDYIYIEPNDVRTDNSRYNQNNAYKVTVISTIVSAASVIASLVIALTVK